MAIILPHIEDSSLTQYIPPKGEYEAFQNEEHYEQMVREWGLSTTREVKKKFWYKENTYQRLVTIAGYETYGKNDEFHTIIIRFQDGNLSCIHPDYLKDMQSASFGKESQITEEINTEKKERQPKIEILKEEKPKTHAKPKEEKKQKKEKTPELKLPLDKVHFTADVKQFALSYNHFNEENEEMVILENVVIDGENKLEVGLAYCSHSKTLKKLELAKGEKLEFDGKIVKKKMAKGKEVEEEFRLDETVLYKINNPSKIIKK